MARMPPINRRLFRTPNERVVEIVNAPATTEHDTIIDRARRLRTNATGAERVLWTALRLLRRQDFYFRRQAPIGPYIADFACKRAKLVVELDGSQHDEAVQAAHDEARTAFLNARGYRVLRFANHEVFGNLHVIVGAILRMLGPTRPAVRDDLPVPGR